MKSKSPLPLEKETRDAIASFMRSKGLVVQKEVDTGYGKIDVLVKEYKPSGELIHHIIECKRKNDSHSLKYAISQLRHYAMHYGKNSKLYFCTSDKSPLSAETKRIISVNSDIIFKVF